MPCIYVYLLPYDEADVCKNGVNSIALMPCNNGKKHRLVSFHKPCRFGPYSFWISSVG